MNLINKNGLLARLAISVIFVALAVGFISAQVFYRITYVQQLELAEKDIKQLFATVSSTASIAAYLEDEELAKEVLSGLVTNDVVQAAQIRSSKLNLTKPDNFSIQQNATQFDIASPFIPEETVGVLLIAPNTINIQHLAKQTGQSNALALIVQALVVTFITVIVAYLLVTKPILTVANTLHDLPAGSNKKIKPPEFHKSSEIGQLVSDVNVLLTKTDRYVEEERKLREEFESLEKQFRMLFENSVSPIILMDSDGNILIYNDSFNTLLSNLGLYFKKSFGPLLSDLFESPEQYKNSVNMYLSSGEMATGEFQLASTINDNEMWMQVLVTSVNTDDLNEYYQITLHDISKRRKQLSELSQLADYDALTKVYNRHGGESRCRELMHHSTPFAFVLMDLNGFKPINDIYGHNAGDEILKYVANQLESCLRKEDLLCRWGGDEFVVILPFVDQDDMLSILTTMQLKISKPYYLTTHEAQVGISASMGAAFYPQNETNLAKLVQQADQAMYQVKRQKNGNPNNFVQFAGDINE